MPNYSSHGILVVSEHRAAVQTAGVDTMMTGRGDVLLESRGCAVRRRKQKPDRAPRFVVVEPVQRMAGGHTRLAPGTPIEIDFKGILLSRPGGSCGQEGLVAPRLASGRLIVPAGKGFHGGQFPLFRQQIVDQGRSPIGLKHAGRSRLRFHIDNSVHGTGAAASARVRVTGRVAPSDEVELSLACAGGAFGAGPDEFLGSEGRRRWARSFRKEMSCSRSS